MSMIDDSKCPSYSQFVCQLDIIENSIWWVTDFNKISSFFNNNKEYIAHDREVALHCDSIAGKVRGIKSASSLIEKMQGIIRELLPADKENVQNSLAYIRQSKSADHALANWINSNEIPLASLNLSRRELENIFPLLTYIDLTDFNGFTDEGYHEKIAQNFGIPALRFICPDVNMATEIALKCAKQNGGGIAYNIQKFGIREEISLVTIALECAKQDSWGTAENIQNFGIKEESYLIAIALECAKQNGQGTAAYIQNFGITEESSLVAVALECAKQNGWRTTAMIKKFGITEESNLVAVALECAKQNGVRTAEYIQNFGIKEERNLVAVALVCLKRDMNAAQYISKFGIKEDRMVAVAMECAKKSGEYTSRIIQNFGIKNESSLVVIALECAKQNGGGTAANIAEFNIQDFVSRYKVFMECVKQNEESFFLIDKFKLSQANLVSLSQLAKVLKSNEEEIEQRNTLFTAIRSMVKELPCSDASKLIIEKKIDEITKLKPHTQNRATLWLLHSLLLMSTAEPSTLDWMVENGLWSELGNLRRPALRSLLTPELFNLASSKHKIEWDGFIAAMKEKKQGRLSLFSLTLSSDSAKVISTLKIDKNSSLNDVHKFTALLEATYLLTSADFLTSEQKSSGFGKIIPEKQDSDDYYQRQLIKNATAAKGLLQLKNVNWTESESDLGLLFRECFEQLIPLHGFEGDAAAKYEEIFASSRNPGGLLTYAAGLKTLNDPRLMESLGQFVVAVFRGDFKEMRYDTVNHPHLAKIAEKHPDILRMWKEGIQVDVEGVKGESKDVFNLKNWVSTKLTVDKHLGDADLNYVVPYLNAQSDEEKKALNQALVNELSTAREGKNKKEVDEDPSCVNLKLQMECMKLVRGGEEANLASFKKEFLEIQRLVGSKYPDFAHDVKGIIQSFEKSKVVSKEPLRAIFTDDPIDWMQFGTDVAGSCLRLDETPGPNKGLLGNIMDGKNRLLVIKDAQGKILARTLLSILWDGEKPVLYREHFYPYSISADDRDALNRAAQQFAEKLNIPLTENSRNGVVYGKPLHALGGPAPYEQSDAAGGTQDYGRYTIASANILFAPQAA